MLGRRTSWMHGHWAWAHRAWRRGRARGAREPAHSLSPSTVLCSHRSTWTLSLRSSPPSLPPHLTRHQSSCSRGQHPRAQPHGAIGHGSACMQLHRPAQRWLRLHATSPPRPTACLYVARSFAALLDLSSWASPLSYLIFSWCSATAWILLSTFMYVMKSIILSSFNC
jgi:hypothetical protein